MSARETRGDTAHDAQIPHPLFRGITAIGVILFVLALVWAILSLPAEAPGLYRQVSDKMPASGVESAVTAVLLNFRAYDTLLEIAVLLVAALGLRAIRLGSREPLPEAFTAGAALMEFLRFLIPVMVILAGYLLWAGGKYPGGAFQAGAVLGAAAILLQIAGKIQVGGVPPLLEKTALTLGVFVFATIGLLCILAGGRFLEYPPEYAKGWILLIEAASMVSIGATLMILFAGRSLAEPHDAALDREGQ